VVCFRVRELAVGSALRGRKKSRTMTMKTSAEMNQKQTFASLARPLRAALLGGWLVLLPFAAQAQLFGPRGGSVAEKQAEVRTQSQKMLADLYAAKPEMKERLKKAVGYATFNQKDINLFLLASGNGYGLLVDNRSGKETFMRMGSLGGGFGMGIKDLRVIFVFFNTNVMNQFLDQGWQFGGKADTSAKYKNTGVSAEQNVKANVDFKDGTVAAGSSTDARAGTGKSDTAAQNLALGGAMEIYQFTESGLSLQATVSGTKYWKDSKLNQ
jgi:lipid-binding SYLF domain-containing protein